MAQLVVHAGFHKTGTKSVQACLAANAPLLAPQVRIYLKDDILPLTKAARAYSVQRTAPALAAVSRAAENFCSHIAAQGSQNVVVSCEDLAGVMPGRRGVESYAAVPMIMDVIAQAVRKHLGSTLDLTLVFTLRDPDSWLASLWWQHLRSTRYTLDARSHARQMQEAADFEAIMAMTRKTVPEVQVVAAPLEEYRDLPHGPATVLLDILEIPAEIQRDMERGAIENSRPAGKLEPVFLALNQSDLPNAVVTETKKRLMRAARRLR
ncbi:hypothetical protein [Primorskyibacter sp. S187A]|uniref:hypothetical protein n=1 Tax=Primorskyibacter sp. S187A TaxID=3415130 RepID=UPI003C7A286F